jgi:hypothetical protein
MAHGGFHVPVFPKGKMTRQDMLKWWLAGKMPGPASREAMKVWLKGLESHRPIRLNLYRGGTVGIWAVDQDAYYCPNSSTCSYGIVLGQTASGNKTVAVLTPESNGCDESIGLKVDHAQNVWLTCGSTSYYDAGGAQEYTKAGTVSATYNGGCPANQPPSEPCERFYGYGLDNAETANTVFVSDEYFYDYYGCGYYECETYGTGFEYWPKSNPSAQPTLINLYDNGMGGLDIYDVSYFDVDSSGNIWTYYYGCDNLYPYGCGTGVAEITNPTNPSTMNVVDAIPPGSLPGYSNWGGIYVSSNPARLNVMESDPSTRQILQYSFAPSGGIGSLQNTLGPTKTNLEGCGEPLMLGFNQGDSRVVSGEDYCGNTWLDVGKVAHNTWKEPISPNFEYGLEGVGFTPSDK